MPTISHDQLIPKMTLRLFLSSLMLVLGGFSPLVAQSFYYNEDFFADSAFVKKHKIKTLTIKIPELMSDTSQSYLAYQYIAYNPLGKMAVYQYDYAETKPFLNEYSLHFYNNANQRFRSMRFKKHSDQDSLVELVNYLYDGQGRLSLEEHLQMLIGEYNDWTVSYEWINSQMRVQTGESNAKDTVFFDAQGRAERFTQNGFRYRWVYDAEGRKSKLRTYFIDSDGLEEDYIKEFSYVYNTEGALQKIEGNGREIVFLYGSNGLPLSSITRDRSGRKIGWQIFYTYTFHE